MTRATAVFDRAASLRQSHMLLLTLLFAFSLWDFYIGEVRVFDFLGLSAAISFVFLMGTTSEAPLFCLDRSVIIVSSLMFMLVLTYATVGIATHPDNLKPAFGMLLGAITLIFVRALRLDDTTIDRSVRLVAYIHLSAFFLQLCYYYLFGGILNYHASFGLQPRLISTVFRPAGLFLEPAIYAFFAFSIFLIRRQRTQPFTRLDYLLVISMYVSLSLWGIVVASLIMVVFRTRLAALFGLSFAIVALALFYLSNHLNSPVVSFIQLRVSNLATDPSTQERFAGTFTWMANILTDPSIIFGNGINNFFEEHGSNGFAYIINSMGLLGTTVLLGLSVALAPPRQWSIFIIGIAIAFTAAPLWTTLYFWCWVALMLHPSELGVSSLHRTSWHLGTTHV